MLRKSIVEMRMLRLMNVS